MRTIHLILSLLGAPCATCALAKLPTQAQGDFSAFGRSLHLTTPDLSDLGRKYARVYTDGDKLETACLTARAALGESQVQIRPLSDLIVDENWSQTCWTEPYCIIQPRKASEVSISLKIIVFFSTQFAVRSGGHSPNPGWSNIGSQGLLVDLQRLNTVRLSSDGTFASVGPGARWGGVYAALDADKAVVAGGREPTIGVGGLVLGGGISHVSNQFGLVADNVKNFEIALANGSVLDCNAISNKDLFWVLKGGGPNFGIVTRYDLYTVPVYQVWVQINAYSVDQAAAVLDAFDAWQREGASDVKSNIELNIALDSIAVVFIYNEPLAQAPAAFAPFFNTTGVPPIQVAFPGTNITYNELSIILGSVVSAAPARHDYRASSTRIDANLTQAVYSFWRRKALEVHNATSANQTFVLQHIGPNLIQQGPDKGGNPLNIPSGAQQWWTTIADWSDAADDDLVRSVALETAAQWEALGSERGSSLSFIYMNDASRDQDPLASYGRESLKKLRQVAERYDPKQIFQTLQHGGFLLARAGMQALD
ncbi:FAD-binding domain-containing protein [Xylariaceae sp. AK1471]|nr:FAD-binding domain-containing protein [Xylariaceae sp. AK1471]